MFLMGMISWPFGKPDDPEAEVETRVRQVRRISALGRRNPVMIMPAVWRRCGPNLNLHDQRGQTAKGERRRSQRTRRLGITFWHRPYRPNRATTAFGGDHGEQR